jgi:hypothetical protein
MLNFWPFQKKNKESASEIKLKMFRRKLIEQSGFSDNTFNQLLEPFMPLVEKHNLYDDLRVVLSQVVRDESLHRAGKKQAFFIVFCLYLATELVKKRDPEYVIFDDNIYVEIVTVSVFYQLISRSAEGYKWVNSSRTLLKDAWLCLKSGKGRLADIMLIPHDESVLDDSVVNNDKADDSDDDEIDLDEQFTSDTEVEIGSLLASEGEPLSDLEVLNRLGADESSGGFNDGLAIEPDSVEASELSPEQGLIDITSLIDKK